MPPVPSNIVTESKLDSIRLHIRPSSRGRIWVKAGAAVGEYKDGLARELKLPYGRMSLAGDVLNVTNTSHLI